jgi:hypothetical protein
LMYCCRKSWLNRHILQHNFQRRSHSKPWRATAMVVGTPFTFHDTEPCGSTGR